jgi:branched-chain amino acid transport system ATP-binding protein
VAAVILLSTQALSRRFGGLTAVSGVDFALERGEIRAIIGPNGAGKTTLVNLICGRVAPSAGRIVFEGRDITGWRPWRRVGLGIAYTFQITSVFGNLTCFDNVALAVQRPHGWAEDGQRKTGHGHLGERVSRALRRVGLAGREALTAGSLAYGHQRLLELAIGLALEPKLLILDEPTQGLTEGEIVQFCALIRDIARSATILLIEHNMAVVMEIASRITVMSDGSILAEGPPGEIAANPDVQRAYLGT